MSKLDEVIDGCTSAELDAYGGGYETYHTRTLKRRVKSLMLSLVEGEEPCVDVQWLRKEIEKL